MEESVNHISALNAVNPFWYLISPREAEKQNGHIPDTLRKKSNTSALTAALDKPKPKTVVR